MPVLTYLADNVAESMNDNVIHIVQKCSNDAPLEMTSMRLGDLIAEDQPSSYALRDAVADMMEGTVIMRPVAKMIRPKKCQSLISPPQGVFQSMPQPQHNHNDNNQVFNIALPEINVHVAPSNFGIPTANGATSMVQHQMQPQIEYVDREVPVEVPVYVEQNVPMVYDRKVPIVTEQNVPVVYDRKVPIVTEQNVPVVYDRKVPIVTEQNVPVVYERKAEGIFKRMTNAVRTKFNENKQQAMLNDAVAEVG